MTDPDLFLSIDFEDFAHDLKRDLGLWETGPLRGDALWAGYESIDGFLRDQGVRATFFCTGIIADQLPDLIGRIAEDGHEVACHYYFHDELRSQSAEEVERNLQRAKAALEEAANAPVQGFRAPKFRIEKTDPAQYRAVERHFTYDSSFFAGSRGEVRAFRKRMGLTSLKLLPIYSAPPFEGLPEMKLGGSYLKLFPAAFADRLLSGCENAGLPPHIYLHPYEFTAGGEFLLSRAERAPLGRRSAAYWGLRQHQWSTIGNAGLKSKLDRICRRLGLYGRLCDHLEAAEIT
ncbi:polysaccharide deacetylase family protein [Salipiger sp. PrR002]|uniref:polysaccharide deacetylase family protein n=1 Tax=Salipiger sp. PrR002 TaxID=2706489 RepID=UPI0013B7CF83|nr:polysaccharide deacetylase family protein [Salipiger sp. PrR002]NDV98442.1 polysaccharide deacetylase family protein [Salipiger sp. PrR002]NDW55154.1 polysaccharide deacetylase family protein [Salipiger sp. PrR004]